MGTILTRRYEEEEMQIIAKNDEHHASMVQDKEFYGQMEQRNQQANQMLNLTQAGNNAAQNAEVLVKHSKESEDWINKKWRPAMGWMYMVVCITDFVLFPILWSVLQAVGAGQVTTQWQPVTLMGAGLFHISMGAVLGIAAYGRTKEKIEGASNNDTSVGASNPPATPSLGGILK
jgi:hypothetical protein